MWEKVMAFPQDGVNVFLLMPNLVPYLHNDWTLPSSTGRAV